MKKLGLLSILLVNIVLGSCSKNQSKKSEETNAVKEAVIVNTMCYRSLYENDSIELKINTLKDGKVTGDMVMKVYNMPYKNGTITGEFRGDTLFVDYTFKEVTNKDKTFKNPMAFLKKDKQLILGNGTMQSTMGVTYLVKDKPIDFERVKYKFSASECVEK
jgi:hypothetical protein